MDYYVEDPINTWRMLNNERAHLRVRRPTPRVGLYLFLSRPSRWLTLGSEIHPGWSRALGMPAVFASKSVDELFMLTHINYQAIVARIEFLRNVIFTSQSRPAGNNRMNPWSPVWIHGHLYEDMVKNFPWTNLWIKCFERRYKLTLLLARGREG